MKVFEIKKRWWRELLSLVAVVFVICTPATKMEVEADLVEPAGYCKVHPYKEHFYITSSTGSIDESNLRFVGNDYIDGTPGSLLKDVSHEAALFSEIEGDQSRYHKTWWYMDGVAGRFKPCPGIHNKVAEPSEYEEGDGNDDDSRPAEPTPHQMEQTSIFSSLDTQLATIDELQKSQATIDGKDLVNSLPNATMKKIAESPNVTVFFTYTYNDAKYTTAIPAGTAIDSSLEWYGPIYMMTHYPTMWRKDANTSIPVVAPVQ